MNFETWLGYIATFSFDTAISVPRLPAAAELSDTSKLCHLRDPSASHSSSSYSARYSEPELHVFTENFFPSAEQALFMPMPNRPSLPSRLDPLAIVMAPARAFPSMPRPSSETSIRPALASSFTCTRSVLPSIRASMALSTSSAMACSVLYPTSPSFLISDLSGVMSTLVIFDELKWRNSPLLYI